MENIRMASEYVKSKVGDEKIDLGVVLGSGLSGLTDLLTDPIIIPYKDIPYFPISTVQGHDGKLYIGKLGDVRVLMMKGRVHYYEGYEMKDVTFPTRVMKMLGIERLLLTNAAGAVNESYKPGDIAIITDHINLAMRNPLIGKNMDEFGVRFPDMSEVYTKEFRDIAKRVGKRLGVTLREGVYAYLTGPSYETPAEVRMIRILGGDMAGMSTVPEAIVARHQGMKVLGISCMTNMAAGILDKPLSHEEVLETSDRVKDTMMNLVENVIKEIGKA